jgi:hypothetical protein
VILEALSVGCPVLISDRTPWTNLEAIGVGWDISLAKPDEFRRILDQCVAMNSVDWRKLSEAAKGYARKVVSDPESSRLNRMLFRTSLQRRTRPAPGPR